MSHPPESPSRPDPRPLLLSPNLARSEVERLLAPYHFRDWEQADANLQLMAGDPQSRKQLAVILPDLLSFVSTTADPDQALNEWERYLKTGQPGTQVFSFLAQAPRVLHLACVLFGNSPAMAETLIRDPMLLYWIEEDGILTHRPVRKHLEKNLLDSLDAVKTGDRQLDALRRFHRREMLRIGARDLFHVSSVEETAKALSQLAEIVIQTAYRLVNDKLQKQYGTPRHHHHHSGEGKGRTRETGFVVLGMGKLGGGELNYSSDVDLVYVYASSQGCTKTSKGQTSLSNEAFFQLLARELTNVLSASTSEGCLFRVDLRLRPEGSVGPLAWSSADAVKYYRTRGRTWERLAWLKARAIAGQRSLGRDLLRTIRPFVVGRVKQDETILDTVHALRTQIHRKIQRKKERERNIKLSPGGIRDIEFIVQTIQLLHVQRYPHVLEPNTIASLRRLCDLKLLRRADGTALKDAYLFLRDVEHKLQMVHELQTHTLPAPRAELTKCAVRMGYTEQPSSFATTAFLTRYTSVLNQVQALYQRIIENRGR